MKNDIVVPVRMVPKILTARRNEMVASKEFYRDTRGYILLYLAFHPEIVETSKYLEHSEQQKQG